jgi:hypothetical protein
MQLKLQNWIQLCFSATNQIEYSKRESYQGQRAKKRGERKRNRQWAQVNRSVSARETLVGSKRREREREREREILSFYVFTRMP